MRNEASAGSRKDYSEIDEWRWMNGKRDISEELRNRITITLLHDLTWLSR